jgi:hypothetical protein
MTDTETWFPLSYAKPLAPATFPPAIHKKEKNSQKNNKNQDLTMTDTDTCIPVAYGKPFAPTITPPAPANMHLGKTFTDPNHHGRPVGTIMPLVAHLHPIDEANINALESHGFTRGLVEAMLHDRGTFALRIWTVDNLGSMLARDGHRLVETARRHDIKFLPCSRWKEMQETIEFQAILAALLKKSYRISSSE